MSPPVPACDCPDFHRTRCPVAKSLRNCWCTPKWLAELVGTVDIDPCCNLSCHVSARENVVGEMGGNGLRTPTTPEMTAFINPPYGNGQVIKWVRHWRDTRFIFLLRWDPSTLWFAELMPKCTHVWFPGSRIGFEPPPRIRSSSNPYPHALYLRQPDDELLARLKVASGYLFGAPWASGYKLITRADLPEVDDRKEKARQWLHEFSPR